MSLPALLAELALPVLGAPMFIISDPGLVVAQCRAGIVGAFPAMNAQPQAELASWLDRITAGLKAARLGDEPVAPYAVSHIIHPSNLRLAQDVALCARYGVPLMLTSMAAPVAIVPAVHDWGGLVIHEVAGVQQARDAVAAGVDGLLLDCGGASGLRDALSPFAFLEQVRAFWDGPIVLSGAINTGRSILAAQIIGADLACVDRRFVRTIEAQAAEGGVTLLRGHHAGLLTSQRPGASQETDSSEDDITSTALVVARLRSEYYEARSARIRLGGATAAAVARPEPLPVLAAGGARR